MKCKISKKSVEISPIGLTLTFKFLRMTVDLYNSQDNVLYIDILFDLESSILVICKKMLIRFAT